MHKWAKVLFCTKKESGVITKKFKTEDKKLYSKYLIQIDVAKDEFMAN
jgi:hypothetical protein